MKNPAEDLCKGFQHHYTQCQKGHSLVLPGTVQMETAEVRPKQSPIQSKSTLHFLECCYDGRLGGTGASAVKIFFLLLDMLNCINFSQFCMLLVTWLFSCEEQHYLLQPADGFSCGFVPEYSGSFSKKLNRTCPDKEIVKGKQTFLLKFHNNDQF